MFVSHGVPMLRHAAVLRNVLLLCIAAFVGGCANFYVDGSLQDLKPEQIKKAENPKPVQLLFEFQTKGVNNARATEFLKKQVTEQVEKSGLFSKVSNDPVEGGAILSVTLNNVPLTDNAFGKGFASGLTFGLAGNTVTDGYICTADFLAGGSAQRITKTVRHAIHTTVGNEKAPANATKVENLTQAAEVMTRQAVSNVLNELATESAFR
jgi:hypothetical protein